MQKNRRIKSILLGGLFSLFVPLAAYLYLRYEGHDGHIKLPPVYGIEKIDSHAVEGKMVYDTSYHTLSNLTLVNQLGDTLSLNETLKGKILVLGFFFTSCHTICPVINNNMKLLNKAFLKNDTAIRFLSISVDPEHDSVSQLREYADRMHANHDKWYFLTGDKKAIYDFARNELQLKLQEGDGSADDFIHPEQLTLIDKYRNIRGYYNGLDSDKVRLCAEDITYLLVEKNKLHEKRKRD
ncbi:MAG: SCO family protein [Chitinophagaceae bacterium]|nr:SCO family protein [Chitinophagaceae bacterium]